MLPRTVAETYCALPLSREGDCILVAVPDADNASHLTRLQAALHGAIRLVTAARSDIKDAIERVHIEPQGMITRMALARRGGRGRARAEAEHVYRVEVTLEAVRRSWWPKRPISSTRSRWACA